MSKSKQLLIIFILLLALLSAVLAGPSLLQTNPVDISERQYLQPFDASFSLVNSTELPLRIGNYTLEANQSIDLRSLGTLVFIRWSDGVRKRGNLVEASSNTKVENSIYGTYSLSNASQQWSKLVDSPISELQCKKHIVEMLNPMPKSGIFLLMRDESESGFYQNAQYSVQHDGSFLIELEESFRRYSSKGRHHYSRFNCKTFGYSDRLAAFLKMVDLMTK